MKKFLKPLSYYETDRIVKNLINPLVKFKKLYLEVSTNFELFQEA